MFAKSYFLSLQPTRWIVRFLRQWRRMLMAMAVSCNTNLDGTSSNMRESQGWLLCLEMFPSIRGNSGRIKSKVSLEYILATAPHFYLLFCSYSFQDGKFASPLLLLSHDQNSWQLCSLNPDFDIFLRKMLWKTTRLVWLWKPPVNSAPDEAGPAILKVFSDIKTSALCVFVIMSITVVVLSPVKISIGTLYWEKRES